MVKVFLIILLIALGAYEFFSHIKVTTPPKAENEVTVWKNNEEELRRISPPNYSSVCYVYTGPKGASVSCL